MTNREIENSIREGLSRLDAVNGKAPEFSAFLELVKREQKQIEKRQKRQAALFAVLSVFIVTAFLFCLFHSVSAFVLIQTVVPAACCLMLLREKKAGGAGQ